MKRLEPLATGWIASETGNEYVVVLRRHQPSLSQIPLNCDTFLDGASRKARAVLARPHTAITLTNGVLVNQTQVRPFMFSNLSTTDDDAFLGQSSLPNPGTIKHVVSRVRLLHQARPKQSFDDPNIQNVIHERSKKAGSHVTQLGEARQLTKKIFAQKVVKLDSEPHATFVFMYRPRAVLQAEGLIPLAVELPVAVNDWEQDRKRSIIDSSSDDEEIGELEARLATLKAKKVNKRVKREAETDGTDSSRPSKRIKREEILVPRPGEMIDLTFDD